MAISFKHVIHWIPKEGFDGNKYVGFVVVCSDEAPNPVPESMHELSDYELHTLINQADEMLKDGIISKKADNTQMKRVLEGFLLRRKEENAFVYGQIGVTSSSEAVDDLVKHWHFKEWKEWDI